jgi:hypothetical protein
MRFDASVDDNLAIRWHATNGNLAIVERLLEHPEVDPTDDDNQAIRWAAINGHLQVVERLLEHPRVDPATDDNCAVRWAAGNGHVKIVERLLQPQNALRHRRLVTFVGLTGRVRNQERLPASASRIREKTTSCEDDRPLSLRKIRNCGKVARPHLETGWISLER